MYFLSPFYYTYSKVSMKKIILFIFIFFAALATQAQTFSLTKTAGTVAKSTRSVARHAAIMPSSAQISKSLSRNIEISFRNSMELQATRQNFYIYGAKLPGRRLTGSIPREFTTILYPGMEEILTSDKQLSNYFVLRNNRETLKAGRQLQKQLQLLYEQIPVLKQHQTIIEHNPAYDLTWLQEQIPTDISYLLIGEIHTYPVIQENIARFLPLIRQKFPDREIFLLTEFLPDGTAYGKGLQTPRDPDRAYNQIWLAAMESNIQTIGLEPKFLNAVEEDLVIDFFKRKDMWSTLEGRRHRNNYWKHIVEQARQQHPNALFIIYAGSGHVLYNEPFSLGTSLASQAETFMISFIPGLTLKNAPKKLKDILLDENWFQEKRTYIEISNYFIPFSQFDFATQLMFPERIVQFTPQYNHLTGFDVQLKIKIPDR